MAEASKLPSSLTIELDDGQRQALLHFEYDTPERVRVFIKRILDDALFSDRMYGPGSGVRVHGMEPDWDRG